MLQVERWAITLRRRRVNYVDALELSPENEENELLLAQFERPQRRARTGWRRFLDRLRRRWVE
jgi:hypothetical protein